MTKLKTLQGAINTLRPLKIEVQQRKLLLREVKGQVLNIQSTLHNIGLGSGSEIQKLDNMFARAISVSGWASMEQALDALYDELIVLAKQAKAEKAAAFKLEWDNLQRKINDLSSMDNNDLKLRIREHLIKNGDCANTADETAMSMVIAYRLLETIDITNFALPDVLQQVAEIESVPPKMINALVDVEHEISKQIVINKGHLYEVVDENKGNLIVESDLGWKVLFPKGSEGTQFEYLSYH
ncbi:hypothetical protein ACPV4O_04345 [Vibrio owensii]|uniref:hypothetical protein n=1 Tax=Vibrio owensii TaxID=696485 RepID=UPI004068D69E